MSGPGFRVLDLGAGVDRAHGLREPVDVRRHAGADLVNRLNALGAVAIGFDVVFPSPTACRPPSRPTSFRGLDAETRDKLAGLPSNDEVLAEAIKAGRASSSARPARR